jgi:hypothetical protein
MSQYFFSFVCGGYGEMVNATFFEHGYDLMDAMTIGIGFNYTGYPGLRPNFFADKIDVFAQGTLAQLNPRGVPDIVGGYGRSFECIHLVQN